MFKDKILMITGGTGSFGNAVLGKFLDTNFSEKGKAWSNLLGSLLLGIPICATILFRGMWCQQCILNAPIKTFEQSMSGYGMQVKYLMAGFLAIYALTMLITFTGFFMSNSSKLLKANSN